MSHNTQQAGTGVEKFSFDFPHKTIANPQIMGIGAHKQKCLRSSAILVERRWAFREFCARLLGHGQSRDYVAQNESE